MQKYRLFIYSLGISAALLMQTSMSDAKEQKLSTQDSENAWRELAMKAPPPPSIERNKKGRHGFRARMREGKRSLLMPPPAPKNIDTADTQFHITREQAGSPHLDPRIVIQEMGGISY